MRLSPLASAIRAHYGPLLARLHCELPVTSGDHWLGRLLRAPGIGPHPLHHLVLIGFLGYAVEAFFALPAEQHPFGAGPWPCLNVASDHYSQERIPECIVSYTADSRRPLGTFACDCGFVYARSGPDQSAEDRRRFTRMVAYGPVWEARLRACSQDRAMTFQEASRQLGVPAIPPSRPRARRSLAGVGIVFGAA